MSDQLPPLIPGSGGRETYSTGILAPTLPLARNTDPLTSKLAADAMAGSVELGQAQQHALTLVKANPGRLSNELARIAGEGDPRIINRRLRELQRAGYIEDRGTAVDPQTGKAGLRWWPVTK